MIDYLDNELKSFSSLYPNMGSDVIISSGHGYIHRFLSTMEIKHLSQNEVSNIMNQDNILLYDITSDGENLFELFSGYNKYVVNYNKDNVSDDNILTIYNSKNIELPNKDFEFPKNETINVVSFKDELYIESNRISKYMLSFPILFTNMPYDYYSIQSIPDNIYRWNGSEFSFADITNEDFINRFNDICENGINNPLFMQISNGRIISASNSDYITLLIAIYLKLPTIPVALYLIKNDISSNMLICSRQIDVLNKYCYMFGDVSNNIFIKGNELCNPYMVFKNTKFEFDISSAFNRSNKTNLYASVSISAEEDNVVDYFICNNTNENEEATEVNNIEQKEEIDIEEVHRRAFEKINNEINKEIKTCIDNLISN